MKNSSKALNNRFGNLNYPKQWSLFTVIYFLIALADITVLSMENHQELREITKPLILISLMVFFILQTFPLPGRNQRYFFLGLFFSFLGDGFLNYQGYFLHGLFSFFTAHVFYAIAFLKRKGVRNLVKSIPAYMVLLYSGGVYFLLNPYLGALKPFVILYMIILITVFFTLLTRKSGVDKKVYYTGLTGGVLFLISDSLLAVNKFAFPTWLGPQLVMITYALAQYFLVKSFLESDRK